MFTSGVKAKLGTQQEARSTKYFFILKRKLTTGPDACSLLAPYAGYGFTLKFLQLWQTIYIIYFFNHFCCSVQKYSTVVVLQCLCPRCWLWMRQQSRSCPRCLKSFMLTVMSAACGKHSACVRSFWVNRWYIICCVYWDTWTVGASILAET